jgi:hypothetical protein
VTVSFADTELLAPSPRLGLRARWRAAREARTALLDLAERLRAPRPVNPEGVRLVRALLRDGAGPLFAPDEPGELRGAALRALWALDRRDAIG